MKRKSAGKLLALLGFSLTAGAVLCLAGCEDSARKVATYHPPVIQAPVIQAPVVQAPVVHAPVAQAATAQQSNPPVKPNPPAKPAPRIGALPLGASRGRTAFLALMPPDAVNRLAEQVRTLFAAGDQEAKANHNDAARQDYDRALDLLLASGFNLGKQPELSELFNQIMSSLSTVPSTAQVAQANGPPEVAAEQQNQPSPLDQITAITSLSGDELPAAPGDAGLKTNAERELQAVPHDLPLTLAEPVLSFLNFFQTERGRAIVENGLTRSGRYRDMIRRVLTEEGLPTDLMYLAQAESAFQPQALSRAGARGLWQFMAYRGKQYGLEHSWWVDERQDPEKATRAAAHHLRDLYDMFGDWYLVMAAYDSGPGAVQHAIERTGYADFWELYKANVLPDETRNYVPIILALTLISKDPARYGIEFIPDQPLQVDRVQPGHSVDLQLVSETIDVDVDTLRLLNPQLLRLVTPSDPRFVLQIPAGKREEFEKGMAQIPPENWVTWRRHRVEEGETLASIARRYRISVASLAEANSLEAQARPEADTKLIIPAAVQPEPTLGALVRYRARRGDTVESVADEFNVTVAELKKWNGMRSNRLVAGMRLKIYPGVTGPTPVKATVAAARADVPAKTGQPVIYHVKQGETLWSIAQAYQTTIEALRSGNRFLFSRPLQAGDILTIVQPH
jgi:membrane-bound lytic murein transglycosylase D